MEIEKRLKKVVARIFEIDESEAKMELTKEESSEWDSFNHLMLINEIEKEFEIKIKTSEVNKIKNLKDLEKIIKK